MTVDWDEELRKLNASEYGKRRADRDLTKDIDDPEALKWAKSNANKAQSAVQETSYKVSYQTSCGGQDARLKSTPVIVVVVVEVVVVSLCTNEL